MVDNLNSQNFLKFNFSPYEVQQRTDRVLQFVITALHESSELGNQVDVHSFVSQEDIGGSAVRAALTWAAASAWVNSAAPRANHKRSLIRVGLNSMGGISWSPWRPSVHERFRTQRFNTLSPYLFMLLKKLVQSSLDFFS